MAAENQSRHQKVMDESEIQKCLLQTGRGDLKHIELCMQCRTIKGKKYKVTKGTSYFYPFQKQQLSVRPEHANCYADRAVQISGRFFKFPTSR